MADLNSLIAQGAQFNMPDQLGQFAKMQQIQQGMQQQQLSAQQMQTGALQQKAAEFQLQKLQEDHANMVGLQQKLSQQGLTPRQFFEALQGSKDVQRQQAGIEGLMKLAETEKYDAYLKSKQTIPAGQPQMPMGGALGTGRFGVDQTPGAIAPAMRQANALAPQAAPAAANPVAAIDARLAEIQNFADPRAQAEVARLQKQRDELVKPHVVGDFLVSGAGNEIFKAPKKSTFLTQEELAQQMQLAAAHRAPGAPRPEQPPVSVIDPKTGNPIYVTREQSFGMTPATGAAGKPMTDLQKQAYKKDFAADTYKIKSTVDTAAELEKLTDDLVGNPDKGIKPHPGLRGITGYAGVLPSLPSGDAAKAEQKLETFKGKIKALGRSIASQDGKLGNMAVQEWQFISDAVQAINPKAGNLDEQMRDVVRQAKQLANNMQGKFDLTYEDVTPAASTPAPKPAPKPSGGTAKPTVSNW